jgi:hypothetical protein
MNIFNLKCYNNLSITGEFLTIYEKTTTILYPLIITQTSTIVTETHQLLLQGLQQQRP